MEQFDWVASYNSITLSTLWSSVKSAPLLQESPVIVQTRTLLHSAQQDTISEEAGLLLISWSTVYLFTEKKIRKFRKANIDQIKKNLHSNWLPENNFDNLFFNPQLILYIMVVDLNFFYSNSEVSGRSQTTLTSFWLFLTTYPPPLTFSTLWTLTKIDIFGLPTYPPSSFKHSLWTTPSIQMHSTHMSIMPFIFA